VLVRAIGPALAAFGVNDPLPDPKIVLYDHEGRTRFGSASDNWDHEASTEGIRLPAAFERTGAFPLAVGSRDAAFLGILDPGAYTVHLTGQPGQSGTALLEIYECDADAATMRNLSTRARVSPGSPAIGGLSIRGSVPKKVLLRAVGPGLGAFGVASSLANPRLHLRNEAGATVSVNDDWDAQAGAPDIGAVTAALGAFPLAPGSRDAALLVALPPGNYTAMVDSESGAGTALIEAYEVP
jgi:hypothetical protein